MSLACEPMGELVIESGRSWRFQNDFGGRACAELEGATWTNDHFTADAVWINGTYRNGRK